MSYIVNMPDIFKEMGEITNTFFKQSDEFIKKQKHKMEIIITINGIERIYGGDYHTLRNNDWNEIIGERLDSLVTEEQEHEKS